MVAVGAKEVTAREAIAAASTEAPVLLLLDINLPDQTGWEILRTALREGWLHPQNIDGDGQKLPVIVLSAVRVGPGRLAEFHPLAYLPKPFPMDALLRLSAEAAQRRATDSSGQGERDQSSPLAM